MRTGTSGICQSDGATKPDSPATTWSNVRGAQNPSPVTTTRRSNWHLHGGRFRTNSSAARNESARSGYYCTEPAAAGSPEPRMETGPSTWQRPYFEPGGGDPLLYYMIYGAFEQPL